VIRSWEAVKARINHCRRCETDHVRQLVVPTGHKRHPPYSPPRPTRLLFVSVAPPWGGSYFWDETQADTLRAGLFAALTTAGYPVATPDEFCEQGFFMVPAVKCPSCHNGKDARPAAGAVTNCAPFLREQCAIIAPERILALGQAAMDSLAGHSGYRRLAHWGRIDSTRGGSCLRVVTFPCRERILPEPEDTESSGTLSPTFEPCLMGMAGKNERGLPGLGNKT